MKLMVLVLSVVLYQSQSVFDWPQDVVISVQTLSDRAASSNYRLDPTWVGNLSHNVSRALRHCKGKCQLNTDILEKFLETLFSVRNGILKYALSENWLISIDLEQLDLLSHEYTDLFEQLIKIGVVTGRWAIEGRQLLSQAVDFHVLHAVQALLDHVYSNPASHFPDFVAAIHRSIVYLDFRSLTMLLKHTVDKLPSEAQLLDYLSDNTSMGRSAFDIVALQCSLHPMYCIKLKETFSQFVTTDNTDTSMELVNFDKYCQQSHKDTCDSTGHNLSHWFQSWNLMNFNTKLSNQTVDPTWIRRLYAAEQITVENCDDGWRQSFLEEQDSVGCDIPVVSLADLDQHQFIKDYINLSRPVLIKEVTDKWPLRTTFKRNRLTALHGDSDVLVGYIPYGEVFGEFNGYATINEFVAYMDKIVTEKHQSFNLTGSPPMYVFDSEILQDKFHGQYQLPDLFSLWSDIVQVHQFILGPKGSGAPFHYHCPAVNVVCYGRKRWFLYPPGQAFYSKLHPLEWLENQNEGDNMLLQCVQNPGDLLFVPSGWTHSVVNMDEVIGVAVEFDTGCC